MNLQVRAKISTFGGFGGPTEVTCGGNALKFYASVRLNIRRTGLVKKGEEVLYLISLSLSLFPGCNLFSTFTGLLSLGIEL